MNMPFDRLRDLLLRMLDLALSLLGDTSETGSGAIEEVRSDLSLWFPTRARRPPSHTPSPLAVQMDLASLRDRILRLRAYVCMLEDEIDSECPE